MYGRLLMLVGVVLTFGFISWLFRRGADGVIPSTGIFVNAADAEFIKQLQARSPEDWSSADLLQAYRELPFGYRRGNGLSWYAFWNGEEGRGTISRCDHSGNLRTPSHFVRIAEFSDRSETEQVAALFARYELEFAAASGQPHMPALRVLRIHPDGLAG
jgi:hypothetical protein